MADIEQINKQMLQQDDDKSIKANWNFKEYYEATRELIKHEDMLASERFKALFTIQTILFAAMAVLLKEATVRENFVLFLSITGFQHVFEILTPTH
jgi:hypothetical protein